MRVKDRGTKRTAALVALMLATAMVLVLGSAGAVAAPAASWARAIGGTGIDAATDVVVDGSDNLYAVGIFQGTVDFDPGAGVTNLTSAGGSDVFITKYNSSGALLWAVRVGGAGEDGGLAVDIDGSGNLYVTGSFSGTADFDPSASVFNLISAGLEDGFVLKLTGNGAFVWAGAFGGTGVDRGSRLAVDTAGNPHVVGIFNGTADFDPGGAVVDLTSAGGDDAFVMEWTTAGAFGWVDQFSGAADIIGLGIDVDGFGNVFASGYFSGTVDMDPTAGSFDLVSAGGIDAWVTKLDTLGNPVWAAHMGGTGGVQANAIAADASGNVYVGGHFEGVADLDPGAGTFSPANVGMSDVFVAKLTGAGVFTWGRAMGGSGGDTVWDLAVDSAGTVTSTGIYQGTSDFDPGVGVFNLTGDGSEDVFLSQLSSLGGFVWAAGAGGTGIDAGYGVARGSGESVYGVGQFEGTVDFDPGSATMSRTSLGSTDGYVWALASAPPTVTITTPPRGADYDYGERVVADYACTAAPGAKITSCVGPVLTGGLVDTSTPGRQAFTVTATDSLGNTARLTHYYDVGRPLCGGKEATIVGTPGPDLLIGTVGPDVIWAGAGNDTVRGRTGDDVICLGPGNDFGAGGKGDDRILADGGNDEVRGNAGEDVIKGGYGTDELRGGKDDDRIRGHGQDDLVVGGSGDDMLWGGKGDDLVVGARGDDALYGNRHRDYLRGGPGFDFGDGGPGRDTCRSVETAISC